MPDSVASEGPLQVLRSLFEDRFFQLVFVVLVPLLFIAGWRNAEALNPDGIAYMRIAEYWAEGNPDLAISAYWGPLLSWIMVPFVKGGMDVMMAARYAMGLSGLLFFLGCGFLFRCVGISRQGWQWGLGLAAGYAVFWSIRNVTPDLLLSGLTAFGLGSALGTFRSSDRRWALFGGAAWGLAYLAKAVALPWGAFIYVGLLALLLLSRNLKPGWMKQAGWTVAGVLVLSAPWMGVLSSHEGSFVFSTSGGINHAIAGPPDVERYHYFARSFHDPGERRVTSWEDPDPKAYHPWSPFENRDYLAHQAKVVATNVPRILVLFGGINLVLIANSGGEIDPSQLPALIPGFDLFYLLALALGWTAWQGTRKRLSLDQSVLLLSLILLVAFYLPMFLLPFEQRYFYPVFPICWILFWTGFEALMERFRDRVPVQFWLGRVGISSWILPVVIWLMAALVGIPNAASYHSDRLAKAFRENGIDGTLAGSALMQGGRAGLYLAFHLGQPWCGDDPDASEEDIYQSSADWIVVVRGSSRARMLDASPRWASADGLLRTSDWNPENEVLQVFGRVRQDPGSVANPIR